MIDAVMTLLALLGGLCLIYGIAAAVERYLWMRHARRAMRDE